jgi:hypothetical protein
MRAPMKKAAIVALVIYFPLIAQGQTVLTPDLSAFNPKYFKNQSIFQKLTWMDKDGKVIREVTLNLITRIDTVNKKIIHLQIRNDGKKDSTICELGSLKPIYTSSISKTQKFFYDYRGGMDVSIIENTGKGDVKFNYKMPSPYFDGFLSEYLIGALPLKKGYSAQFEFYRTDTKSNGSTKINRVYDDVIKNGNEIQPAYVLEMETGNFTYLIWVDQKSNQILKSVFSLPNGGYFLKQRI